MFPVSLHHSLKIQHHPLVRDDCLILDHLPVPQPANEWGKSLSATPSASVAPEGPSRNPHWTGRAFSEIQLVSSPVCTLDTAFSFICLWTFSYQVREDLGQRDKLIIPIGKVNPQAGPSVGGSEMPSRCPGNSTIFHLLRICYLGSGLSGTQVSFEWQNLCYLRRRFVLASEGQNSSGILTLYIHILLCDPFNRSLIFLWSKLATDSNENKLWPTFRELPLSSLPPVESGSDAERKRSEKPELAAYAHVWWHKAPRLGAVVSSGEEVEARA